MKPKLKYALSTFICLILCILIVKLFVGDSFIRGFIGDFVFVMFIFFLVKSLVNVNALKLGIAVLCLAYLTEFAQYGHIIRWVGLERNAIARIVLGATFDPLDLLAYTLGIVAAYVLDILIMNRLKC